MRAHSRIPIWSVAAPILGAGLIAAATLSPADAHGGLFVALLALGVVANVLAAVHHADLVAHRIGEPFGTLVLALAVTLIEVALIVSLMAAGGEEAAGLARDTVFAAVMIILNGIIGLCLLVGGALHREQSFSLDGVSASLVALGTIVVMTLVFPNYTVSAPGPFYSPSQLLLIAAVTVVVYGAFVFSQTVANRALFLEGDTQAAQAAPTPGGTTTLASAGLLLLCLACVVLLAKKLAPSLEDVVLRLGAPIGLVGVIIAAIVLLPEATAALNAARSNRLQTSLNLALGSALASIGLTIPAVSFLSLYQGSHLMLGIDSRSSVLLLLSLFVVSLALRTGRTIILHGVALLVIFVVYLFTTVVP